MRWLPLLLVGFALSLALVPARPVDAQALGDAYTEAFFIECETNPNLEKCICAPAARLRVIPKGAIGYNAAGDPVATPVHPGGVPPIYDPAEGIWVPQGSPIDVAEFDVIEDEHFKRNCSLSFFREDLNRGWRLAVAVGAAFLSLSLVWAGFSYMQEASSGADLAKARARVLRIFVGIIIVGMSVVIWEGLADFLFGFMESWTSDPHRFYEVGIGG